MTVRHLALVTLVCTTGLALAAPATAELGRPAAARAGTSQTLGQTAGTCVGCPPVLTAVQHTTGTSPAYQASAAGVVTSFSYLADGNAGTVRALVFTRTTSNSFQLVGKSTTQAVAAGTLNTFPTRIPVPAGALLGRPLSSTSMRCFLQATASFDEVKTGVFDPDTSSTMATTASYTNRLNI